MTLTQIKPAGLSKPVDLADNEKIRLGTGNDLEIFHDGTNSGIQNAGGGLYITTASTGIFLRKGSSEELARFNVDGAVELYHDNVKKFETTSTGVNCTAGLDVQGSTTLQNTFLSDSDVLNFGTSNDLQIYHDGSHSRIKHDGTGILSVLTDGWRVNNAANNESFIRADANGAVELYYDSSKKFETGSAGIIVSGNIFTGDNNKLQLGENGDLELYHDGTNSFIKDTAGASFNILATESIAIKTNNTEFSIACNKNGAVELYYDNAKKLETFAYGVKWTGQFQGPVAGDSIQWTGSSNNAFLLAMSDGSDLPANSSTGFNFHHWNGSVWKRTHHFGRDQLYMPDNVKLLLGTSNDLQIYHDGSHSRIDDSGTGALLLQTNGGNIQLNKGTSENMLVANTDGAVQLYYDGNRRFETTNNGFAVKEGGTTRLSFEYSNSLAFITANGGNEIKVSCGNGNSNGIEFWDYTGVNKRCQIDGHGIKFGSDTAEANALQDYEEGTWTPTVTSGGLIGNTVSARYTKIGRMVHWQWYANMGTMTSTATFTFEGLPFSTPSNSQYYYGTGRVQNATFITVQVNASSTNAHIYESGGSTLKYNTASNNYVLLSGVYEAG